MQPDYTTDWSHRAHFFGGFTQYRIELAQTDHGWYQRHIWRRTDGVTQTEDWISSPIDYSRPEALKTFTKIENESCRLTPPPPAQNYGEMTNDRR